MLLIFLININDSLEDIYFAHVKKKNRHNVIVNCTNRWEMCDY